MFRLHISHFISQELPQNPRQIIFVITVKWMRVIQYTGILHIWVVYATCVVTWHALSKSRDTLRMLYMLRCVRNTYVYAITNTYMNSSVYMAECHVYDHLWCSWSLYDIWYKNCEAYTNENVTKNPTGHPHDGIIKWKHSLRYWPFVRGIHRWPMDSAHKGQWRGALMFSLTCAWING